MRISDWSSDVCSSDLPLLQHIAGRIHDPRVYVAELLQREEVRRVSGVVELEGGRLVDRHGNGAGVRVAAVARVQRDGFRVRAGFAVVCHALGPFVVEVRSKSLSPRSPAKGLAFSLC